MISVIVPVYKSELTLERCVNSLLAQTYQDMEILLVVDGPPDNSGILAEELAKKDGRIRVINQSNQGVSKARNKGITEARGEYIRFVDSDDYVPAESNEVMLQAMEQQDADLVIAGYHHLYFGRDKMKLPKSQVLSMPWERKAADGSAPQVAVAGASIPQAASATEMTDATTILAALYQQSYLNMPWNKLYRKDKIKEGFPVDLNLGEDLLFNLRYMEDATTIVTLDAPVCYYIQDDRGTTLSTKKRMDKIPIALRLYQETAGFFIKLAEAYRLTIAPSCAASTAAGDKPTATKQAADEAISAPAASGDVSRVTSPGITAAFTRICMEFLDEIMGLAYDGEMPKAEKIETIKLYEAALEEVLALDLLHPQFPQLDYKLMYPALKNKNTRMTYFLLSARGCLVKILRKR